MDRAKLIPNLNKEIVSHIINIILSYKQPEKVSIFGSRGKGSCTETSDIDIAIFGKDWSDRDINLVKDMLENRIKTPLKFDVLNFYSIKKEGLKNNIVINGRVIYEKRKD